MNYLAVSVIEIKGILRWLVGRWLQEIVRLSGIGELLGRAGIR